MSQIELNLCNFQPWKPIAYRAPVSSTADVEYYKLIMPIPNTMSSSLSAGASSPPEGRRQ